MTPLTGLTSVEAAAHYAAGRHNRPPKPGTKSIGEIWRGNLLCPFNLVIGGILLFLLAFWAATGDIRLLQDCVGVSTVALLNTLIAVTQEIRAKRAMDKVNMLIAREVTAIRDGKETRIPHDQIVMGDLLLLRRGDQAVVDGPVAEANHLEMDESLLTGESEPVAKDAGDTILSGSYCVAGTACYTVERLSDASYASQVTRVAQKMKASTSPLQRSINRIVKLLFVVAVGLCLMETAIEYVRGGLNIDFVRRIATILMGLVPQGLVLTSSVVFALGIYRISKAGAVVQTFHAVESFSAVRVICMDKTGTLTQNRMTVRKITPVAAGLSSEAIERLLGTYARLAGDKNATNRALEALPADPDAVLVSEVPFSSQRKMSSVTMARNGRNQTYVLGACEVLAQRCSAARGLPHDFIDAHGLDVFRNLLFGAAAGDGEFSIEPLAVVSLSDTVRTDVREVLERFAGFGITFKVLSGDSAQSIRATCRDIGWDLPPKGVITGSELDALDETEFAEAVEHSTVFARLKPEHKVKIVGALRERGFHTAMIGDGVNDVPAIKQSDLGIAMEEGAAITREVADFVLRENRFTLLPQVFEEGNRIVNTVAAVAKLFLTKNLLVIYLTLATALFMLNFPLTPRRVSLFNVFAIGLPAMIIAFTNANSSRVQKFFRDLLSYVALSALVIVLFAYAGSASAPADRAPMVMVSILVLVSVANFLIVVLSSDRRAMTRYAALAVAMVAVYGIGVSLTGNGWLLRLIRAYYEISPLDAAAWTAVAQYSAAGAAVLVLLQWWRARLIQTSIDMKP
jgi:cation-transporting ATPase E